MIQNPIGGYKLSDINARNITWKQLYQHGNMTINFKLTWKQNYVPGNISINLKNSKLSWKHKKYFGRI